MRLFLDSPEQGSAFARTGNKPVRNPVSAIL
jgi:hypothetical protein